MRCEKTMIFQPWIEKLPRKKCLRQFSALFFWPHLIPNQVPNGQWVRGQLARLPTQDNAGPQGFRELPVSIPIPTTTLVLKVLSISHHSSKSARASRFAAQAWHGTWISHYNNSTRIFHVLKRILVSPFWQSFFSKVPALCCVAFHKYNDPGANRVAAACLIVQYTSHSSIVRSFAAHGLLGFEYI